jgi:lysophospholipid acyltransferase (LPLAT)-like uncharacterized protein
MDYSHNPFLMDRLKNKFQEEVLPGLVWLAIQAMHATLRIRYVGEGKVETLRARHERLIYVLWHGRFYMILRYLTGRNVCAMASTSRDGRLIANIVRRMGYAIAAGSSSKSAERALVTSLRMLQAGFDLVITVDGPKGPAGVVKPGALFLARKTKAWIVPFTFAASPGIALRSWDRYRLPMPFSRILMVFGEPYALPENPAGKDLTAESELLEKRLNSIGEKADAAMQRG